MGSGSAGIPLDWAAEGDQPGVWRVHEADGTAIASVAQWVEEVKGEGDVVVASIHWGPNWGYPVPAEQRRFARLLIDGTGVDLVHGHSSHHPKGLEIHRGRLILYGCGDFLNDYEGIPGGEEYRPELTLMIFPDLDPETDALSGLALRPMRIAGLRLRDAEEEEADWLLRTLNRESARGGLRLDRDRHGTLFLDTSGP